MLLGEEWRDNAWGPSRECRDTYILYSVTYIAAGLDSNLSWSRRWVVKTQCHNSIVFQKSTGLDIGWVLFCIVCHHNVQKRPFGSLPQFRSFSVPTDHGATETRAEFPREWWCQFCAVTPLRRGRSGREHGGVRAQLLSRWQDGRSLQEWRLCMCSSLLLVLFWHNFPFIEWVYWHIC